MAHFDEHIIQEKKNLAILESVSLNVKDSCDWQVTIAFYVSVHLVNAHIAKTSDLHYRTHKDVKNALYSPLSICKIPDEIYTAYLRLEGLSRRARYLCHEDSKESGNFFTHGRHLNKSLNALDKTITFFEDKYSINLPTIKMDCIDIKSSGLKHFGHHPITAA